MTQKRFSFAIYVFLSFALILSACMPAQPTQTVEPINQATRSAAATAQAEVNVLQREAEALEKDLDANFSDHYVGMRVESYPVVKVIVYLTGASKEDLASFVKDKRLTEVIEVQEEEISRKALRETRETLKAEMDKAGVTYTTGIKMEPARLQVYVLDIPEAQARLKAANVAIPEHVEFVQMDYLPEGG
ncbi:MAG: hypothetical protein WBI14_01940 [Anaerolineaceae bacterium]